MKIRKSVSTAFVLGVLVASASPAAAMRLAAGGAEDPVLLAAGDIADCNSPGDEATALILDREPGTIATLGDNVYENGTADEFARCYEPTWGRHKARTRPAVGNHEYHTPGAAGYYGYFGAAAGDPAKGYYSYDARLLARRRPEQPVRGDRRVSGRLAAGPVARGRPRRQQRELHARVLAPSSVQLGPARERPGSAAVLDDALPARRRTRAERARPRLRAVRPADAGRRRRTRRSGIRQFTVGTGGRGLYSRRDFRRRTARRSRRRRSASSG